MRYRASQWSGTLTVREHPGAAAGLFRDADFGRFGDLEMAGPTLLPPVKFPLKIFVPDPIYLPFTWLKRGPCA